MGEVILVDILGLVSRPNGASIAELMEELELDRSGVYRHLEFVQELGFQVYDDRESCGRKVRKKLMDGYLRKLPNVNIPDVVLKPSEVIALYLLKGEGRLFRDTEIGDALEGAFTKIGMFADDGVFDKLKKVKTLLVPCAKGAKDYSKKGKIIDDLARAIFSSRVSGLLRLRPIFARAVQGLFPPAHFTVARGALVVL